MSVTRPTGLPNWGASGATNIVTPLGAQQELGWGTNEVVPASILNHWQQNNFRWLEYLDQAMVDGTRTRKSLHVDGVGSSGQSGAASAGDALISGRIFVGSSGQSGAGSAGDALISGRISVGAAGATGPVGLVKLTAVAGSATQVSPSGFVRGAAYADTLPVAWLAMFWSQAGVSMAGANLDGHSSVADGKLFIKYRTPVPSGLGRTSPVVTFSDSEGNGVVGVRFAAAVPAAEGNGFLVTLFTASGTVQGPSGSSRVHGVVYSLT